MGGLFASGGGGGTENNVAGAPQYVPTGQPEADQLYQQLYQSFAAMPNYAAQDMPGIDTAVQGIVNNPYAAGAQTAANTAGTQLIGLSTQDLAESNTLNNYGNTILNTAMDPQNALYNQQVQQLQDQVNATNSEYGLGNSPVGASITGNDIANFNLNWENQQLARQESGLSAAQGADTTASNLGGTAATEAAQAGSVPNQAYTGNLSNILNALTGESQAGNLTTAQPTTLANLLQSYLGLGQTANAANLNAQTTGFEELAQGALGAGILGNSIFGSSAAPAAASTIGAGDASLLPDAGSLDLTSQLGALPSLSDAATASYGGADLTSSGGADAASSLLAS